jgi:hypothetical protein
MPRRPMRVATIFTGVAACTVGMTQVATAQDIRPQATARPAGAIYGDIKYVSKCAYKGVDGTDLHVSTSWPMPYSNVVFSDCFGERGEYLSPVGIGVREACGGNNHGWLTGVNAGRSQSYWFAPGTTYHTIFWSHLYVVDINSWSGRDTCPIAPNFGLTVY